MFSTLMKIFFLTSFNNNSHYNVILFNTRQEGFIKLEILKEKTYLISTHNISIINKNKVTNVIDFSDTCNDVTVYNNTIVLATNVGLKVYNPHNNSLLPFIHDSVYHAIKHVAVDKSGKLWFSEKLDGCYMMTPNNKIYKKVTAPVIYSLACTPDSNVWVGTNIGMYKIPPRGTQIFRYVEEGLEGFDLPDNLVERIFADDSSNIWAITPDYISFISSANFRGEIPNYTYVGNKQNIIYDICKIPINEHSYLFSTSQGLIYTAEIKGNKYDKSGEIHQVFQEKGFSINDSLIHKPKQLKDEIIIAVKIINNQIFFITNIGLWSVPMKEFISSLSIKYK